MRTAHLLLILAIAGCDAPRRAEAVRKPLPPARKIDPALDTASTETNRPDPADVVRTYAGLIAAGRYRDAQALWGDRGRAAGMSADALAESFAPYAMWHADVGPPGRIEGAAGSLYVEVPVRVRGLLRSGEPFDVAGSITLRRVNDVPGSTPEQRAWHLDAACPSPRASGRRARSCCCRRRARTGRSRGAPTGTRPRSWR